MKHTLFALVGFLLASCDQAKYDNPLDADGTGYRPRKIVAFAAPTGIVHPANGDIASDRATLAAQDVPGWAFRYWQGFSIDGSRARQVVATLRTEPDTFLAWFAPTAKNEVILDDFDAQGIRCGAAWCTSLSIALHAESYGTSPLLPWFAFRDSLPGTTSTVGPLEGGSVGNSALDSGVFFAASKGLHVRLHKGESAGYAGVGMTLSPSASGVDLAKLSQLAMYVRGKGKFRISFHVAAGDSLNDWGSMDYETNLDAPGWTYFTVSPSNLRPTAGSALAAAHRTWQDVSTHVRDLKFMSPANDTGSVEIRVDFLRLAGLNLQDLLQ